MKSFENKNKLVLTSTLCLILIGFACFLPGCQQLWEEINHQIEYRNGLIEIKEANEKTIDDLNKTIPQLQAEIDDLKEQLSALDSSIAKTMDESREITDLIAETEANLADVEKQIADFEAAKLEAAKKIEETQAKIVVVNRQIRDNTILLPCFAGDTLVLMVDNSVKAIKDIQAGEMVWSFDTVSGQMIAAPVTGVSSGNAPYYYLINGNLKVTPPHPFFTATGEWVKIEDLMPGDKIKSNTGLTEIVSIERVDSALQIYNIYVENFTCFFVSADGTSFFLARER